MNEHLRSCKFNYEDIRTADDLFQQGDWFFKFDYIITVVITMWRFFRNILSSLVALRWLMVLLSSLSSLFCLLVFLSVLLSLSKFTKP